ncbi:hypothetical protein TWF694_004574 [Orbilia ellipsospora]|uniref:CHAT domain-containing protein n=1 Tax=Orbilia ellipsospora TaxID=2528407 RepID=A0AAV9WXS8_9PEZI
MPEAQSSSLGGREEERYHVIQQIEELKRMMHNSDLILQSEEAEFASRIEELFREQEPVAAENVPGIEELIKERERVAAEWDTKVSEHEEEVLERQETLRMLKRILVEVDPTQNDTTNIENTEQTTFDTFCSNILDSLNFDGPDGGQNYLPQPLSSLGHYGEFIIPDASLEFLDMDTEELHELVRGLELTLEGPDVGHIELISHVYYIIFLRTGSLSDIQGAVDRADDLVNATNARINSLDYATYLRNLIALLLKKYQLTQSELDLDRAIHRAEEMVTITPLGHPDRESISSDISKMKFTRESRMSPPAQLDDSELLLKVALAMRCMGEYDATGNLDLLRMGLKDTEQAVVKMMLFNSPWKSYALVGSALISWKIFQATDNSSDLRTTIRAMKDYIATAHSNHPLRLDVLPNLIRALELRYQRNGDLDDLETVIQLGNDFIATAPFNHQSRPAVLSRLLLSIPIRYAGTGNLDDLDTIIQAGKDFMAAAPFNHQSRLDVLRSLILSIPVIYKGTGNLDDLDTAIQAGKEFIAAAPSHNPFRAAVLMSLIWSLQLRYEKTGNDDDLNTAISLGEDADGLALESDDPRVIDQISKLFVESLDTRNGETGNSDDIQKLLKLTRIDKNLAATSHDDKDTISQLSRHIRYIASRSLSSGNTNDKRTAAQLAERVAAASAHLESGTKMSGIALLAKSMESNNAEDIRAAREKFEEILACSPDTDERHALRGLIAYLVSSEIYKQFQPTRNECSLDNLELAIEKLEEARSEWSKASGIFKQPTFELMKQSILFQLIHFLQAKYCLVGNFEDLSEAVKTGEQLIAATRYNMVTRAMNLTLISKSLLLRFNQTGITDDLKKAASLLVEAVESRHSPPHDRIKAAQWAARTLGRLEDWEHGSRITEIAIFDILPSVSLRQLNQQDQQSFLQKFSGLVGVTATAALNAGKGAYHTIKLLEMGRGIIAGLRFGMRSDLTELRRLYPEVASNFERLRDVLDPPGAGSAPPTPIITDVLDSVQESNERYDTEAEFIKVTGEIRNLPGFRDFLLPPLADDLMATARPGPIIIISADHRCDALIVQQDSISSIPLQNLHKKDVEKHVERLRIIRSASSSAGIEVSDASLQISRMLEWLWDAAVGPILEALGFLAPPQNSNDLPRVWWIPTGKLSSLPLHAAGYHQSGSTKSALDRVISSYATSIKALQYTRKSSQKNIKLGSGVPSRGAGFENSSGVHKAVLVHMDETPGHSNLRYAKEEVVELDRILPPDIPRITLDKPCKSDIMECLNTCSIFHFAGHGKSDLSDPSKSALMATDWKDDPLTVEDFIKVNHKDSLVLAYLSACSTSNNDTGNLEDEFLHLSAACQLAGFQNVIGSLWEVSDRYCVDAAKEIYRTIGVAGVLDGDSISLGVHNATRLLRDITSSCGNGRYVNESVDRLKPGHDGDCDERGPRNAKVISRDLEYLDQEFRGNPLIWAAYIHIGA